MFHCRAELEIALADKVRRQRYASVEFHVDVAHCLLLEMALSDNKDCMQYSSLYIVKCALFVRFCTAQIATYMAKASESLNDDTHCNTVVGDCRMFDSTGMFHWCPEQSLASCLIVSVTLRVFKKRIFS